jgi:VWFA-related protein
MLKVKICLVFLLSFALLLLPGSFPAAQERSNQEVQLRLKTELVRVPVVVIDKDREQLYTELRKENFTLLEDGVPQTIAAFESEKAPLTMVLLLEASGLTRYLRDEIIWPAGLFVSRVLEPQDYASLVTFDLRPRVLSDFTRNRQQLLDELNSLNYGLPAFHESNLFDAVKFVLRGGELDKVEYKGLAEVKGRTGVLLIASGIDTFSRINYDEAREIVASTGTPVYSIGIGELAYLYAEPYLSGAQRLTFLQAQNTLNTLAEESGGRFYSVRFEGALKPVLESIAAMLRYQYTLYYSPSNPPAEGEKREIKLLVDVNGDGQMDNDKLELQYRRAYVKPELEL